MNNPNEHNHGQHQHEEIQLSDHAYDQTHETQPIELQLNYQVNQVVHIPRVKYVVPPKDYDVKSNIHQIENFIIKRDSKKFNRQSDDPNIKRRSLNAEPTSSMNQHNNFGIKKINSFNVQSSNQNSNQNQFAYENRGFQSHEINEHKGLRAKLK